MGLDVTAYERVTMRGPWPQSNAEWNTVEENEEAALYVNPDFPAQADGMKSGRYATSGGTKSVAAGSYSGYNRWREQLAALVGTTPQVVWESPTPGPFVELINFSDCEGVIGPRTSAKLANDFDTWEERAATYGEDLLDGDWWMTKYREWQAAFKLAANTGAVDFH